MNEYEKKYKEALERAKSLLGNCPVDSERSKTASIIFPELAESEDERIRKEILDLVSISGNGNQFEEIKNWLEKQGEQKPAEWSEDDEHRRKDAIYFLESAKKHYADTSEIENTIDWLKSLRPQPQHGLPSGFYLVDEDGHQYYSKEFRYNNGTFITTMKVEEEQKPADCINIICDNIKQNRP